MGSGWRCLTPHVRDGWIGVLLLPTLTAGGARYDQLHLREDIPPLARRLPLPPLEMRQLVGLTDEAEFDNPSGGLVFPYLSAEQYASVFDFGCGCGRIARQLIQQQPRPERYMGIDLHLGMIEWCRRNLEPTAP